MGEHRQHDRLGGADRGGARGLLVSGRVEQAPDHRDDPLVDHLGLRVLVLVDQVLGERLGGQQVGLRLHPAGHERGEVERGVAVEVELVVHELVGGVGAHALGGQPVLGDVVRERAPRVGGEMTSSESRFSLCIDALLVVVALAPVAAAVRRRVGACEFRSLRRSPTAIDA